MSNTPEHYRFTGNTGKFTMTGTSLKTEHRWLLLSVATILTAGGILFSFFSHGLVDAAVTVAVAMGGVLWGHVGIHWITKQ